MRIDGTRFEEARSDDAGQPNAEGAGFKGAGLIEMDETFYERVYEQVRKVPSGSVCTYGTIAELAGYPRASREVGYAMSRAQRAWELPCHRIVNAKGTLAPSYQRALLEAEGVAFLDDDTIDMRHHRWPPSDEPEQLTLGL